MQLLRDSNGWKTWVTKAKAYLGGHRLTHLLDPNATPPVHESTPLSMAEQVNMRVQYINACVSAKEQGMQEPPVPTYQRLEPEGAYQSRLQKWNEENSTLWSILIGATDGDAFRVATRAPEHDGVAAWKLLVQEYDKVSDTSLCLKYDNIFSMKMKGTDIEKHINLFREKIKALQVSQTFPPGLEKTMFLRTLPANYAQFKTKALTDRKLKPEDCYTDAKEWSEATQVAGSDEHNLRNVVAMLLSDKIRDMQNHRRGGRRPINNHSSRYCKFGNKCTRRNCGYKHPSTPTHRHKKDNWQCKGCRKWNYPENKACFKCKKAKPTHRGIHEVAHQLVHDT